MKMSVLNTYLLYSVTKDDKALSCWSQKARISIPVAHYLEP